MTNTPDHKLVKEITDQNFENKIQGSEKIILVDFWASWCGPCRQLAPLLDELAYDMFDKIEVYKCNIDENPETPSKYAVRGIPTIMLFKEGKIIDTKVGSLPKSALYTWVKSNI